MDSSCVLKFPTAGVLVVPSRNLHLHRNHFSPVNFKLPNGRINAIVPNGYVSQSAFPEAESGSERKANTQRGSLESLFCYDKAIPEEIIEKPVGLSLAEKLIGDNRRCTDCQAKGAVLCATCAGSGLYVDAVLESQGIIVKVRCLGCGGTGNIMCGECGGRGHLGLGRSSSFVD